MLTAVQLAPARVAMSGPAASATMAGTFDAIMNSSDPRTNGVPLIEGAMPPEAVRTSPTVSLLGLSIAAPAPTIDTATADAPDRPAESEPTATPRAAPVLQFGQPVAPRAPGRHTAVAARGSPDNIHRDPNDATQAEAESLSSPVTAVVPVLDLGVAVDARQSPRPAPASSSPVEVPSMGLINVSASTAFQCPGDARESVVRGPTDRMVAPAEPGLPPDASDRLTKSAPEALLFPHLPHFASAGVTTIAGPVASTNAPMPDRQLDLARDGAWLDSLARDIASAGDASGKLRFALAPPSLGRMDVDLLRSDSGIHVHLTTQTETARAILAEAEPHLVDQLRGQGVRVADTQVSSDAAREQSGQRTPLHGPFRLIEAMTDPFPTPDAPVARDGRFA